MLIDKNSWEKVSLGKYVQQSRESVDLGCGEINRYVAGEHMSTDELKISRWGIVGDGYLGPAFVRRFHPGQVLYGSRRTYLRKLAVADFDGVCANTTFVLGSSNPEKLSQDFLPFIMTTEEFHAFSIRESKGSVNPYVNWSDLAKYEFLLPPLDQQLAFAKLFWGFEESIRSMRALDVILKETLDTYIDNEIEKCVSSKLLPKVAKVLDSQRVPINSTDRNLRVGNVPYYGAGGQVGWIDKAIFNEELVLVGEDATLEVYRIVGPSWVNNHAHVLRPSSVSQDWLFYTLSRMNLKSLATNGTRLKLTQAALNAIEIPIPINEDLTVKEIREIENAIHQNQDVMNDEKLLLSQLKTRFFGGN